MRKTNSVIILSFLFVLAITLTFSTCDSGLHIDRCRNYNFDDCWNFDMNYDKECFSNPCFNPDNPNEFIAIQHNIDTIKLVRYNYVTHKKTILLHHFPILSQPQWGLTGWIVFSTYDWKIWKIKDDGSELQQLTFGENDQNPLFNSDGDRIVYPRRMNFSNSQLKKNPELASLYKHIIINLNGDVIDSFCRPFDTHTCSVWEHASWQGDKIVANYGPNNDLSICGIAVYDHNGNQTEVLFDNGEYQVLRDLEWIWGTNEIIYSADDDGLVHFRNEKKYRLRKYCSEESYSHFSISNDGQKIIAEKHYVTMLDECSAVEHREIILMDIDGNNEKEVEIPE